MPSLDSVVLVKELDHCFSLITCRLKGLSFARTPQKTGMHTVAFYPTISLRLPQTKDYGTQLTSVQFTSIVMARTHIFTRENFVKILVEWANLC